jgi:predicted metal-dependent phosphoesterase TrpH
VTVRVAPHVHSDWSYDGRWKLAELARAFARRGYDAVLMAEHDRTFDAGRWTAYQEACAAASADGALLVPGIEYSDAENRVHVPVWGVGGFLGAGRPTAELLADVRAHGGVAVIAHPGRRDAWRVLPDTTVALAHGIEIWNRKYDGWAPSAEALELVRRARLQPYVGLDFHTARQFFPLALAAPGGVARDPDAVADALRAGRLVPTALRLPAARLSDGRGLGAARAGERARRLLRQAVRHARRTASR